MFVTSIVSVESLLEGGPFLCTHKFAMKSEGDCLWHGHGCHRSVLNILSVENNKRRALALVRLFSIVDEN